MTQFSIQSDAMPLARFNGVSMPSLSLIPRQLSNWLGAPSWDRQTADLPSRYGVLPAPYVSVGARDIGFGAYLVASTVSERLERLETLRRVMHGVVEVAFDDAPDTVLWGTLADLVVSSAIEELGPWGDATVAVDFVIRCHDAARYSRWMMPHAFQGGVLVRVPCGDLPSPMVSEHVGPLSGTLTLRWRNASGDTLETLVLAPEISASERLVVDHAAQTIVRVGSGNASVNVYGAVYQSGVFLSGSAVGAAHGARSEPEAWPSFEASVGSGILYTREAWSV